MTYARVAFVLAGSFSGLGAEVREGRLAAWLASQGADARICRLATPGAADSTAAFEALGRQVPLFFAAADNPDAGQHAQRSHALFRELERFAPEAVVVKGFGYELVRLVVANWQHRAHVVGIVGGLLNVEARQCHALLIEDEYQQAAAVQHARHGAHIAILPKLLPWELIDALPDAPRTVDIVNVGSTEPRKRQELLAQTFPDLDLRIAGGGPLLSSLRSRFADQTRTRFLGHQSQAQTLALIKSAKLLVHVSNFEGFPRVFAEAAACGTPVVALEEVTPVADAQARGIWLSTLPRLRHDVMALLADAGRREQLGRSGLAHARAHATEARVREALAGALEARHDA